MLAKFKTLKMMLLETISPSYSKKVAFNYWNKCSLTHSDMSENIFQYYFEQIKNIILPSKNHSILDYGCGFGEISLFFYNEGYCIECCDISSTCIEKTKKLGLKAFMCNELNNHTNKYDIIFINNAFFYIHPLHRKKTLKTLYNKLAPLGRLYIFDEPDYLKREHLNMSKIKYLFTSIFPVYQHELAGFFNNPYKMQRTGLACGFKKTDVMDSWCNYRSHFIFYK